MDILFDDTKTRTYKFLFPILYENSNTFKLLYQNTINCYFDNNEIVCIQKDNTILRIEIHDLHKDDYTLFLKGKYSKLSGILKAKILKTHCVDNDSYIYSVLFRTNKIKNWLKNEVGSIVKSFTNEAEYYYKPNLNTEHFNYYTQNYVK